MTITDGKKVLDYLIITHPHEDHIKGIGRFKDYVIKNIFESGHRLFIPKDEQENYQNYYDMLDLFAKAKRNGHNHKKLTAYNEIEISDEPEVKFLVLSPTRAYLDSEAPSKHDIHEQCLVFRLEYKNISVLFTGDSCMEAWKDRIVPYCSQDNRTNLINSTILHASHHGSFTFFKPKDKKDNEPYLDAIQMISPEITVITVGENNPHGHADKDALEIYQKNTDYEQVYLTKDHGSIFVEINDDGNYKIITNKILRASKIPTVASVKIMATPEPKSNGLYDKGVSIDFMAVMTKKPSDQKIGNIKWTVQNNAVNSDKHNNYYIGQDNSQKTYRNYTAYTGSHILLCEIKNIRGNLIAASELIVNVE